MLRPITAGPSRKDADAYVLLPKYTKRIPPQELRNGHWRIRADRIYDSSGRRIGLSVDAKVSASGRSKGETVSVSLNYHQTSIRCIDWEAAKTSVAGRAIHGWHEHLWDDEHGRDWCVPFAPPLESANDLERMFICACQHWNIEVRSRRGRDQILREANSDATD